LGLEYRCDRRLWGDTGWLAGGLFCGTRGVAQPIDTLAIRLTGNRSNRYDVFYDCRIQGVGDVGPFKNGGVCGAAGQSRALEAVKIWVTRRSSLGLRGVVHLEGIGDRPFIEDIFAGTREGRRVEGFSLDVAPTRPNLGIEYMCHLENAGDQPW